MASMMASRLESQVPSLESQIPSFESQVPSFEPQAYVPSREITSSLTDMPLAGSGHAFIGQVVGSLTVMHPLRSKEAGRLVQDTIWQLESASGKSATSFSHAKPAPERSMIVDGRYRMFPDDESFQAAQDAVNALRIQLHDMDEPYY